MSETKEYPHPERFRIFSEAYRTQLAKAVAENPSVYGSITPEEITHRAKLMVAALVAGNGDKEGKAITATLKQLKISDTYKAIRNYLAGGDEYFPKPRRR